MPNASVHGDMHAYAATRHGVNDRSRAGISPELTAKLVALQEVRWAARMIVIAAFSTTVPKSRV